MWHDDHIQQREAFVPIIPPMVCHLWEPGDKKIAQLALLQVLYASFSRPSAFRGRRGLWFIDNTAASFHDLHRDCFLVSPLAVTSFNRYSRLVEALSRRFAFCLTSLYFDDAHVTDRKSCKGSGQELCSSCTGHHPVLGT